MVTDDNLQATLSNLTGANSIVINTAASRLTSTELYLPSTNHRSTESIYTNDHYDEDDLEVIDAKQFNSVDIDPFEEDEGSSSSVSSKMKEEGEENEFDFDLNDFNVDLDTDFDQSMGSLPDLNSLDGINNIEFIARVISSEEEKSKEDIEMKKTIFEEEENNEDEEIAQIREPIIRIKLKKRGRGRTCTRPFNIVPKRPVGRPKKPIPEPKIVIKRRE
jgi:hypothetical protein